MKTTLLVLSFLFLLLDLNARIIYLEPVRDAKNVSIENNIIIGFDEEIKNTGLNSVIIVSGSKSGIHSGEIILTADRKKLIFNPDKPFHFDEKVEIILKTPKTQKTTDNKLFYSFQTQAVKPDWEFKDSFMSELGKSFNEVSFNNSDSPGLPILNVVESNNPSPGNLMLGNFPFGPTPYTPYRLIANNSGEFTYFKQGTTWQMDYRRQGDNIFTFGANSKFYVEDSQHNLIDSFVCGNGYPTDLHDFKVLENGHVLMVGLDRQIIDMSQIVSGGNPSALVIGLVIQELDENKNVIFQWRSFDHIAITDAEHEDLTAPTVDYVHVNAIDLDFDGNILISSRHLSEITKISRTTGEIIWRLGGVGNQFTFVNDSIGFSYQHHIRRIPNGNITLYDNGNFRSTSFSRAVEYQLDEQNKIATLVWQFRHTPDIEGFAMGSVQRLKNGNTLIGWGSANPSFTEVTPSGDIALEMDLPADMFTYRIFRDEAGLTLNLKLAIEGLYDTLNNKLNVSDTVTAYLRSSDAPFPVVDSAKSVIDSETLTGNFEYNVVSSGTYYIIIKHRNGIETWSKAGGESFSQGGVYLYDLTGVRTQAYGRNMVKLGEIYCIYSGDVNQDGNIDLEDVNLVHNDILNFTSGYADSDVTGNGVCELYDLIFTYNNSIKFVSVKRP